MESSGLGDTISPRRLIMFLIQAMVVVDTEAAMAGEEAMEGAMVRKMMMMAVSVGCYAMSSG